MPTNNQRQEEAHAKAQWLSGTPADLPKIK